MNAGPVCAPSERRVQAPRHPRLSTRARAWSYALGARSTTRHALVPFVEVTLLTALVPVLGHLARPADPFALRATFFWPLFAPVLAGLRYGAGGGVASALALDAWVLLGLRQQGQPWEDAPLAALGAMTLLAMICGQCSESWDRARRRLESDLSSAQAELTAVSREHFLLEVSHDRLEAQGSGGAPALRDALVAMRRTAAAGGRGGLAAVADGLLAAAAGFCRVEAASVHLVEGGQLAVGACATLGQPRSLSSEGDPLARAALESRQVMRAPDLAPARVAAPTRLLLAAPLLDARGDVRGVLCVEAMPFLALDEANLRLLGVLAGYAGDALAEASGVTGFRRRRGEALAARILRAARDAEQDVPTSVLAVVLRPDSPLRGVAESVLRDAFRASDELFLEHDDRRALITAVLAGTDARGAQVLAARLRERAASQLGGAVPPLADAIRIHAVRSGDTAASVFGRL